MIYIKSYKTEHGYIVAMCDDDLLGKRFSEGKIELDLEKYRDFYNGALKEEVEIKKEVKQYKLYTANIVGKRSVAIAAELGLADSGRVKKVSGVPFLQIYNLTGL